jgi:F-type H+-transporting ATPase subunit a
MAPEQTQHALTPAEYIAHHLGFNVQNVGEGGGFWRINMDTLFTSIFLGCLVIGLIWWVARKAQSGVPSKTQAFVEIIFEFVDEQAKSMFHGDRHAFIAPAALTVFLWVLAMNMMSFLPVDFIAGAVELISGSHEAHWRPVPTSDINTTFALALSVWILMIFFAIKVKGFGGLIHEIFYSPFGGPKFFKPKSMLGFIGLIASPLLLLANFMFNMIEYISKPLSHSLRLFGNLYAGEVIFLLLGMLAGTSILGMFGAALLGAAWSIFHLLVVPLQAFIFMMMTIVYLSMAHESH